MLAVRSPRLVLGLLLAALLLPVLPARADLRREAKKHFARGMELIRTGEYEEGVAALERAYELKPHPVVIFNIARAWTDAGEPERALHYYRRYLESDPADRSKVEAIVTTLEAMQREELEAARAAEAEAEAARERASRGEETLTLGAEARGELDRSAALLLDLARLTHSPELEARAEALGAIARSASLAPAPAAASEDPGAAPDAAVTVAGSGEAGVADETGAGEGAAAREPEAPARPRNEVPDELPDEEVYAEQVVAASRLAASPLDAPGATAAVSEQDLRLSGASDLAAILRRAAGVEVMTLTPGDSQVSIRGLNQRLSNKVLVLIDGRSVYLDFLGTTLWPALPVARDEIERIEVIRGPASALYGADAFSGIINIVLRDPGEERVHLSLRAGEGGTLGLQTVLSGRTEKGLAWRASAHGQQAQQHSLPVDPERADLLVFPEQPQIGLRNLGARLDLTLRPARGFTLRGGAGLTGGSQTFLGIGRLRELHARDSVFGQTHLSLSTPWGVEARAYWNLYRADVGDFASPLGSVETRIDDLASHAVDAEVVLARSFHLLLPHELVVGAGYRFKSIVMSWLDDDHLEHHLSAFLEDALVLHPRLRLTLSGRLDHHPLLEQPQLSPRAALNWRFTDTQALRLSAGSAFRSPTFVESYLDFANQTPVRGVTALGLGNRELLPEVITSFELGYRLEGSFLAVEANAYYNRVSRQILLSRIEPYGLTDAPGYLEDAEAFPVGQLVFENDDARFRQAGAELGCRFFPLEGVDAYFSYAFHDTRPEDASGLEGREADRRTPAHALGAGLQYRSPFGLELGVDLSFRSGTVWVEQVTDEVRGVRFEAFELPAYTVLDAWLGYRFPGDRLELALTGSNLVDAGHREHPFGQRLQRRLGLLLRASF
ncbi:MAG: TonB-dependent receptor [Deltaproteobacteria bacterium]|nr:TonB-dependent receptor [Deltaproteobacteria bacterium]